MPDASYVVALRDGAGPKAIAGSVACDGRDVKASLDVHELPRRERCNNLQSARVAFDDDAVDQLDPTRF